MKVFLLPATILTLVLLFSTADLNAQTTIYYDQVNWPSTQLPMGPNDPFNLRKLLEGHWEHSEAESTATDKIYRFKTGYGPTSQSSATAPHAFEFNEYDSFQYGQYLEQLGNNIIWTSQSLPYEIDEDNNIRVYDDNTKNQRILILTDQLMQGILIVRNVQ